MLSEKPWEGLVQLQQGLVLVFQVRLILVFGDFAGYQSSFLRLFGFGLDGVDYEADTDPDVAIPSVVVSE